MVKSESRAFRFWDGDELPNKAASGLLTLHLREGQEEVLLSVYITEQEKYPDGYGLEGICIEDGTYWKVSVVVYPNNLNNSGVMMVYDMARNT